MDTPIADFVKEYNDSGISRLHMPGHKGKGVLGCEALDITEIKGADALYEASGIIEKSESNATALFGTQKTLYSTEGSSQCIRAMLYLATGGKKAGDYEKPLILAARNVHKSFLYAAALLDIEVEWLYSENTDSICSCIITPDSLERKLASMHRRPVAVYITSPDYLGGMSDIKSLAEICHKHGIYLLVDNAHGAYTGFLEKSLHPMDLGADICCDSAHKTLPVLTGGAYLHIGKNAPAHFVGNAKMALALFGSTSPSYLILQSLDLCNKYLADEEVLPFLDDTHKMNYRQRLKELTDYLADVKKNLTAKGWDIVSTDPLKLVIRCNGYKLADSLRQSGIECEYADSDYLVLMLTPENTRKDYSRLEDTLESMAPNDFFRDSDSTISHVLHNQQVLSLRQAIFADHETLPVARSVGRLCASPLVSCPPAIPIVISGELISVEALALFEKYHITHVEVVVS